MPRKSTQAMQETKNESIIAAIPGRMTRGCPRWNTGRAGQRAVQARRERGERPEERGEDPGQMRGKREKSSLEGKDVGGEKGAFVEGFAKIGIWLSDRVVSGPGCARPTCDWGPSCWKRSDLT